MDDTRFRDAVALTGVFLALALAGCEVRPTEEWVPRLGEGGQAPRVVAAPERVEPAWADPATLRIVDARGETRALAVRVGNGYFWTGEGQSLPASPALAGDPDEAPQPLTVVVAGPTAATLALRGGDDDGYVVPVRTTRVLPGARLQRWAVGADGIEREVIDVLAVSDRRIRTSCPRAGNGFVFDLAGALVPAVWVPDPDGGCPLLVRVPPPVTGPTAAP